MSNIFLTKTFTNILKTTLKHMRQKSNQLYELKGNSKIKKRATTKTKMQRTWKNVEFFNSECPPMPGVELKSLRLMSYNILAQNLLLRHMELYEHIDWNLLKWPVRLQKLRTEIEAVNPDILCLQEMQCNHLQEFVKAVSGQRKLEFLYKKKTSDCTDGCAIIYDKEKVTLIGHRAVEYLTPGHKILNRDNVAILAKFRLKSEPTKIFIVATTHLLYNPRREDVREAQIGRLMDELAAFSVVHNYNAHAPMQHLPIILTGDFNFEPCSSPFNLLNQPLIKSVQLDENDRTSQWKREKLQKVLHMEKIDFGDRCASTYQDRWIVVDYIWVSYGIGGKMSLAIQKVYNLPTVEECKKTGQIPNSHLGSDHFSLAIDFSVT